MSHGQATEYIGFSQTTLSQRLTSHRQNGSIYDHLKTYHNIKPTREHLTENTKIIAKANDRNRLAIKEALLMIKEKPIINKQFDNFCNVLKLFSSKDSTVNTATTKTHAAHSFNAIESPPPSRPNVSPRLDPEPGLNPEADRTLNNNQENVGPDPNLEITDSCKHNNQLPLIPISPRTIRLLTSPIKLNLINEKPCHNQKSTITSVSHKAAVQNFEIIPDMETILRKKIWYRTR